MNYETRFGVIARSPDIHRDKLRDEAIYFLTCLPAGRDCFASKIIARNDMELGFEKSTRGIIKGYVKDF